MEAASDRVRRWHSVEVWRFCCPAPSPLPLVGYIYADMTQGQVEISSLSGLGIAAVLLCLVGLYDDLYNMRGAVKLIWQLLAAIIIVALGPDLQISRIGVLRMDVQLGAFGVLLAIFWILAAINSLNLIDGMDGLATSLGFIFSVTIGIMTLMTYQWLEAIIAFAMAGSLLGFLRHNWPPARIYLGDSGSMLIGVVLGTLAIRCEVKDATAIAVAAPAAIFTIPLLDSFAALVRRKLTGRSIYATDRGHIHHRLLTQGLSNRQALFLIAGLCTLTCAGSILSLRHGVYWGYLSVALVIAVLLGTRIFGHSELMLLNNRLAGFGKMLMPGESPRSSSVVLQGTLQWEEVWEALVESADRYQLIKIRLNLYLPQLHEDFFATWQRRSRSRSDRRWTAELPLVVDSSVVGVISVVGVQTQGSVAPTLIDFCELVLPLEQHLEELLRTRLSAEPETDPDQAGRPIGWQCGVGKGQQSMTKRTRDLLQPASLLRIVADAALVEASLTVALIVRYLVVYVIQNQPGETDLRGIANDYIAIWSTRSFLLTGLCLLCLWVAGVYTRRRFYLGAL